MLQYFYYPVIIATIQESPEYLKLGAVVTEKLPTTTTLLKAVLERVAPVNIEPSRSVKHRWAARFDHVEIGGDSTLQGVVGYGNTKPAAIRDLWFKATDLGAGLRLVVDAHTSARREWRWDGERWQKLL